MDLFFVRHGQTDDNLKNKVQGRIDNPLNEIGKEQVLQTAIKLKELNVNFDMLCSSPLLRARESAEIINNLLLIKNVKIMDDLTERAFGILEGLDVFKVRELVKIKDYKSEGYETDQEICKRVYNCVDEIRKHGEKILIVCHSHTIKAFLNCIDKNYDFVYPLKNAQIVHIVYNNGYTIKSI